MAATGGERFDGAAAALEANLARGFHFVLLDAAVPGAKFLASVDNHVLEKPISSEDLERVVSELIS